MALQYPVYRPYLMGNEKKYVNQCLDSQWISSQGTFIELFESAFAEYLHVQYAHTCCNGTVALHLALLALDISAEDEVLVPTLTYVASANAIHYVGAKPVFIDAEAKHFQMDPHLIEQAITPKTKAIMVTHLYGHACDMAPILQLAKKYRLYIIEDCAEALGTQYHNEFAGTFGDIACFSFFGNKTITTGEGGMVVTNNPDLSQKITKFKGQGVSKTRRYFHDIIGYNYRMTNICSAIGLAQLENIHIILEKKLQIARWYYENLKDHHAIRFHSEKPGTLHTHWLFSILVSAKVRDSLMSHLLEASIETRPFFIPMHQLPIYQESTSYPVAEQLAMVGINLPSYPALSKEDVNCICEKIREGLAQFP